MDSAAQGSRIRLISKSQIRYEGTLSEIDPVANTVSLKNVRMFGTENRPSDRSIPASDALYDYIIFRGSDIKDLTVFEDDKRKQHDFVDPAVVSAQPSRRGYQDRNQQGGRNFGGGKGHQQHYNDQRGVRQLDYNNNNNNNNMNNNHINNHMNSHMNNRRDNRNNRHDFRGKGKPQQNHGHGGGRQYDRRPRDQHTNPFATHTGTNFKAKNEEEAKEKRKTAGVEEDFNFADKTIDKDKVKEEASKEEIKAEKGYDKKKSFFDSLSSEITERNNAEHNKLSKDQREKLRKYDIDTFGADAVTAIEKSFHRDRKRGQGRGGNGRGHNRNQRHYRQNTNNNTGGSRGGRGGTSGGGSRGRRW